MFWLDWKLFGNGHGLASPYWDDVFYWLVDTNGGRDRRGRGGRFYHWIGGFGAQLASIEWRTPKPGTTRRLLGHDFLVFSASRKWLRVEVSWTLSKRPLSIEDIRSLKQELLAWGHG